MDTLQELVDYCNLKNPAGALLLKGEWGCGKTYLIDHTLKESLKDTHYIVRISLFGITSISELHHAVKNGWLDTAIGIKQISPKANQFLNIARNIKDSIEDKKISGLVGTVLSIDYTSFMNISNKIGDKPVILVFDDLERSKLNILEMLGAINEYCENKGFNVILVADEERLLRCTKDQEDSDSKTTDDEMSFQYIKEKVVMRTVQFEPALTQIVKNVIDGIGNKPYKELLWSQEENIIYLLAGKDNPSRMKANRDEAEEEQGKKRPPHNIRSLKAALQDFERVFVLLQKYKVHDIHLWLLSFLAFSMAARANMLERSKEYDYMLTNREVESIYPGYYEPRCFPKSLVYWMMEGQFDETNLKEYLELHYLSAQNPVELIKNSRIDCLDEKDIENGITDVIREAYEGKLSYDQYVIFVENNKLASYYGIELPQVDWGKVKEAINKKIENDINTENNVSDRYHETISEDELVGYTEDERETYQIIKSARDNYEIVLGKNKKLFIQTMENNPEEALWILERKRFKSFDMDMAHATLEGYKKVENVIKRRFPPIVEEFGKAYARSNLVNFKDIDDTIKGFTCLRDDLSELLKGYRDQPLKHRFTLRFSEKAQTILDELNTKAESLRSGE